MLFLCKFKRFYWTGDIVISSKDKHKMVAIFHQINSSLNLFFYVQLIIVQLNKIGILFIRP